MAVRHADIPLDAATLVPNGPERTSGIAWPLAVDRWLDNLLERARASGIRTTRKELVAAILTADELSITELKRRIDLYNRRTNKQLLRQIRGAELAYRPQPPGRRTKPSS